MTRRGKSQSTRPVSKKPPAWCKYSPEEVEALVIKLAKDGFSPSKIGVVLRDHHGVPLVKSITGKTVVQVLRGAGLASNIPEDLTNLMKRAARLRRHLEKNKGDVINKRALQLVESRIRRLAKYYKREGFLPKDWKYVPEAAVMAT